MAANWDEKAADTMLAAHEYRQLDASLRLFIDVHRHAEAVDWVEKRAAEGHVPVLYHAVRNLLKVSSGGVCRVMGSAEFRRSFGLAMLLLLRCAQDVISVAVVQGQAPRLATFNLIRDKVFGWIASQFPPNRWPPLREVVRDLQRGEAELSRGPQRGEAELSRGPQRGEGVPRWAEGMAKPGTFASSTSYPLPVWVLGCAPGAVAAYLGIGSHLCFDNPSPKSISACDKTRVPIDEERERVAGLFFPMVGGMSWEGVMGLGASAFLQPADQLSVTPEGAAGSYTRHSSPCLSPAALAYFSPAPAPMPSSTSSSALHVSPLSLAATTDTTTTAAAQETHEEGTASGAAVHAAVHAAPAARTDTRTDAACSSSSSSSSSPSPSPPPYPHNNHHHQQQPSGKRSKGHPQNFSR
jgi:hypothetical protein